MFQTQVHAAKRTEKPLVIHLRGNAMVSTDAVYLEALAIVANGLSRRHPIYLHCYTGSWDTYMAWTKRFSNLLLGFSSKSTETEDFQKVARSVPFEKIALESDAPHLSPFKQAGKNTPFFIHHQAGLIGRARNVPTVVVLSGACQNVRRLFRI